MILFEIVIKEKQQGETGETGGLKKKKSAKTYSQENYQDVLDKIVSSY